jgi:hypothetical protein
MIVRARSSDLACESMSDAPRRGGHWRAGDGERHPPQTPPPPPRTDAPPALGSWEWRDGNWHWRNRRARPPPSRQEEPGEHEPVWQRPWVTVAGGMLLLVLAIAAIAGAGGERDGGDEEVTDDPAAGPTTTLPGFGDGTRRVNDEIAPGLYVATALGACSWERRRDVGGGVIARDDVAGQAIVEIVATDVAFHSTGCGRWQRFVAPPSPADAFREGDHAVNSQIRPGRYQSDGGSRCSWERRANFRGEGTDGVIAEGKVEGPAVVDIVPTDVGFSSSGCGDWHRVR